MKKYYKYLDIIRIYFCIAVLLYHIGILKGGFLAVCSFFVLSGYLSYNSLYKEKKIDLKKYYINKFKRLYLPLLVTIFISLGIIIIFINPNIISLKRELYSILLSYNNLWQLNANMDYFARHIDSPYMHLWYISILIQFDLIFPIIFKLLKTIREKINKHIELTISIILTLIFTGIFIYSSFTNNIMTTYYHTLTRVFSLFLGVTVGVILNNYKVKKLNKKKNNILFIILNIVLIPLFIFINSTSNIYVIGMIITTIITGLLIYLGTNKTTKENKIIKYISNLSYEIYLVQYPIIYIMQNINLNEIIKIVLIIILTILTSIIINYTTNLKKINKLKIISIILILIPTIIGIDVFIGLKDHTKELKQLEHELKVNEKLMKQKQDEILAKRQQQIEEYNNKLNELISQEGNLDEVVRNLPITGVGDSVMLGAINGLYNVFPNGYFDAKQSRTAWKLNGILLELNNSGKLGNPVLINLGANGDCPDELKIEIMNNLQGKDVFWFNVTNDRDIHINDRLNNFASNYDNLHIVDWNNYSNGHYDYFVPDGIHLTEKGVEEYSNFAYQTIYNFYKEKIDKQKEELQNNQQNTLKDNITFIGNDLLLNVFNNLNDIENTNFEIDKELDYTKLLNTIKTLKQNALPNKIIILLDSKITLTNKELVKLKEELKDTNTYLISINKLDIKSTDNFKIINIDKISKNKDYFLPDRTHLNDKGNIELSKIIKEELK